MEIIFVTICPAIGFKICYHLPGYWFQNLLPFPWEMVLIFVTIPRLFFSIGGCICNLNS